LDRISAPDFSAGQSSCHILKRVRFRHSGCGRD
jgi:hypothetical protein